MSVDAVRSAREEIAREYRVSAHGTIESPGKFERQSVYVPYFYASYLDGGSTELIGIWMIFEVSHDEREAFPELGETTWIVLREDDQGFVHAATYQHDPRPELEAEEADDNADPYEDA